METMANNSAVGQKIRLFLPLRSSHFSDPAIAYCQAILQLSHRWTQLLPTKSPLIFVWICKKIERAKRFSPCCQNKMFSFQQLSSFLKTKVSPVQLSLCSFCVCVSFAVAIWRPRPHATPIWWPRHNYLLTRQTATPWQPRVNTNKV